MTRPTEKRNKILIEIQDRENWEDTRKRLIQAGILDQNSRLVEIIVNEFSEPNSFENYDIRFRYSRHYLMLKSEWDSWAQKIGVSDEEYLQNTLKLADQARRYDEYFKELRAKNLSGILSDIKKVKAERLPQYESKWISIVNTLHNSINLKPAKVAKAGSRAKLTDTTESDMDVIFCYVPDQKKEDMYPSLEKILKDNYGKIAQVNTGTNAIHVDFTTNPCKIDLVLLTEAKFNKEYQTTKVIYLLEEMDHAAIILLKNAVESAQIKDMKGFQIEQAIFDLDEEDLPHLLARFLSLQEDRIAKRIMGEIQYPSYYDDDDDD